MVLLLLFLMLQLTLPIATGTFFTVFWVIHTSVFYDQCISNSNIFSRFRRTRLQIYRKSCFKPNSVGVTLALIFQIMCDLILKPLQQSFGLSTISVKNHTVNQICTFFIVFFSNLKYGKIRWISPQWMNTFQCKKFF